jgi:hypothetical protein
MNPLDSPVNKNAVPHGSSGTAIQREGDQPAAGSCLV